MARYKEGLNGPLSGKVGNAIAANWRGIDYLRSNWEVTKPASAAQLKQRRKFTVSMGWVKPLISIINIGYRSIKTAKTALNAAVSYHMKHALVAVGADFEIDFSKAIFSIGHLHSSVIKELSLLPDGLVYLSWEDRAETLFNAGNDLATFIIYNPKRRRFITYKDAAMRADAEVMLELPPQSRGCKLHLYMFYARNEGDEVSTSVYIDLKP